MNRHSRRASKTSRNHVGAVNESTGLFAKKLSSTAFMVLLTTSTMLATTSHDAFATCNNPITGTVDGNCTFGDIDVSVASGAHINNTTYSSAAIKISTNYSHTLTNNGTITTTIASGSATGIWIDGNLTTTGSIINNGAINVTLNNADEDSSYGIATNDVDGTIVNNGSITVTTNASGSAVANAYGIDVSGSLNGTITNNGSITVTADNSSSQAHAYGIYVEGNQTGTITNNGSITAIANNSQSGAYAYGIDVSGGMTGAITNNGSITATANNSSSRAYAYGIYADGDVAGTITNSGSITATATSSDDYAYAAGISIAGGLTGSIVNGTSGTINVTANSTDDTASAFGIYIGGTVTGSITNNGSITVAANNLHSAADAFGVWVNNLNGTVINNGHITVTAQTTSAFADGVGIYANDGIGTDGVIINNGYITVTATGEQVSAYGILTYDSLAGSITNTGSISATATSLVNNGSAYGIYVGSITTTGSITNSGSISATATAPSHYVQAVGIYVDGAMDGSIINTSTGSINVSATNNTADQYNAGIYIDSSMGANSVINNAGAISVTSTMHSSSNKLADNYGIIVNDGMDDGASITNGGAINVTSHLEGSGAEADAFGIYAANMSGTAATITNNGAINVTLVNDGAEFKSAFAVGIWVGDTIGDNSGITNNGTITVGRYDSLLATEGSGYVGIYGDNVTGTDAFINNKGTISVTANGNNSDAYGVYVYNLGGTATITNSGTIIASDPQNPYDGYSIYVNEGSGTVNNTGTLIGSIYTGGTVAVNNSGTIVLEGAGYIDGNYTQTGNGVLGFGVVSNGNYSSLLVGTANFTGSNKLEVLLAPGNSYAGGTLTDVIDASTLTHPNGFTVSDNSLAYNFTATVVDSGHEVNLTPVSTGISTLTGAVNAAGLTSGIGAAGVLDGFFANGAPVGFTAGIGNLGGSVTDNNSASNAVSQVLPLLSGGVEQFLMGATHTTDRIIQSRLDNDSGFSSGDGFTTSRDFWLKPFGSWASQSDRSGASGYNASTGGVVAGGDAMIKDKVRLGVAFAYAHSDVDSNGAASQSDRIDSYQGIVYGSYDLNDRTEVNFQADIGDNENSGNRSISFADAIANSSYSSWSEHVGAGVERKYECSQTGMTFVPSVRADYTNVSSNGYTENGAGVWDENVQGTSVQEFIVGLDGKVLKPVSDNITLTANLGAGYDVINDATSVTSDFVGGGASFVTTGIKPSPWIGRAGLGAMLNQWHGVEITARYDLEAREDFTDQTASLKFRLPF